MFPLLKNVSFHADSQWYLGLWNTHPCGFMWGEGEMHL